MTIHSFWIHYYWIIFLKLLVHLYCFDLNSVNLHAAIHVYHWNNLEASQKKKERKIFQIK